MTGELPIASIPRHDLQHPIIDCDNAPVAPISRLPNELLLEVFELTCCLGENPDADIRDISLVYPSGRSALRLSLVCSRWRDVALGAPHLWIYIIVCVNDHKDLVPEGPEVFTDIERTRVTDEMKAKVHKQAHPIEGLVELYLLRSREHPLAIHVDCFSAVFFRHRREGPIFQDELLCDHLLSSTLRVLSRASAVLRWQYAHINVPHAGELEIWPRPKSMASGHTEGGLQAPLLEFLHIEQETTHLPLSSTPELHTLSLSSTRLSNLLAPDILKADGLRSLTLRSYLNSDLRDILPTLRPDLEVTIEDFHPSEESRNDDFNEYQSPLTTLSIHLIHTGLQPAALFCGNLIAPNLTTLEIVRRPNHRNQNRLVWAFPLTELIVMLRKSSPPLTFFRIEGFAVMDIYLLNLLHVVPSLTHFIYADPPQDGSHTATPVFFRALTQGFRPSDSDYPLFLPLLQHLELTFFASPFSNPQPLLNMICARGKPRWSLTSVARLEFVKLAVIEPLFGSSLWAGVEDALTELKKDGLNVSFRRTTNSDEVYFS